MSAITDPLTGLANQLGLTTLGNQMLAMAKRMGFPVELLLMDVDGLEAVNDARGRDQGDRLLQDVAGLLEDTFRESDVIARLDDDEFCALLSGAAAAGAENAIVRLQGAIDQHNDAAGRSYHVSVSVGHAGFPAQSAVDLDEMLRRGGEALAEAKRRRARR